MALTPSTMIPLGTIAPSFALPDAATHKIYSLDELKSETATVILFICNHCPFVKHIQEKMVEIANQYQTHGIAFIAINSNDTVLYPEDSLINMQLEAKKMRYPFLYLFDETQVVARAYQAACTPDIYVFDKNLKCVYRGRFDNSTPTNNLPVTGADLSRALDCILAGNPISEDQKNSIGCNIKWKQNMSKVAG
ncbi:MAG: anti-oxidant AhpCTSA family protein [uncultured bacterium]|nr:MAG: anti-oxidant AhpCTSA family protein [uncultured bacterium]OGT54033.1 MAG: alkyl hydroperoxide reductase [Gammaproteobacteria bacterium RIFCSPHIGHO2_12_FULL_42_10]